MSISTEPASTAVSPARPGTGLRWWRARTELGFAAGVLAIAVFMIVQTLGMEVPEGAGTPGPQFFPGLVSGFLLVVGVLLALSVIRTPRHAAPVAGDDDNDDDENSPAPAAPDSAYVPVDYRTTGIVLAGLIGFALLLQPVGWLITASALFWVVSFALGSKRPLFDIAVSVIVASVIQIAFSAGLGLGLPPGILEGVLPWSN